MTSRKPAAAKKASSHPAKKPDRAGLAAYFEEGLFLPDLAARNKPELFEELVDALCGVLGKHNRQTLLSTLHHREVLGTTGIGRGVAVPHGRTLLTRNLRVAFGRSKAGIDYGSPDQQPVHLVFLVVAPFQDRGNLYLPTLGKLIEHVREQPNRDRLLAVETFEDLLQAVSAAG